MAPKLIKNINMMQRISIGLKKEGKKLGCVPTMGYLHDGHLSLVKEAKKRADIVVVTIFVNPTQFGPKEDFERYPRDLKGDLKKLEGVGADYVFYPSARDMYPEGYQTYVETEKISKGLCGDFRPGHFRGVCTVVAKLFNIVMPDFAVFGEKDYQQLKVIERMTADLNFPIKIIPHPTVREKDGLAMSSRNAYLSPEDRENALSLSKALFYAKKMVKDGERDCKKLVRRAKAIIEKQAPSLRLEYLEIRDAESLEKLDRISKKARMLVAGWVGRTRLIDNIELSP